MKTFNWTVPEPTVSDAERREHAAYSKGRDHPVLSKADREFIRQWGAERALGPKAFRRKIALRGFLALSILTGGFLLLKALGFLDRGATLFSSTLLVTLVINAATFMPSWKKNEKRYHDLTEQLDSH